eukprot:787894_1
MALRRLALVTGANKGIGYSICKQLLATQNFNVILGSRSLERGQNALENLKKDIPDYVTSDNIDILQLDVSNEESIKSTFDYLQNEKKIPSIDVLINNAGVAGDDIFNSTAVDRIFATNFWGAINMTNTYLPLISNGNASKILFMGSRTGSINKLANKEYQEELNNDNLTYDKLFELMKKFQNDLKIIEKENNLSVENNDNISKDIVKEYGWWASHYGMSKLGILQYGRILVNDNKIKDNNVWIGSYCPGFVRTDMTAAYGDRVPLLPDDGAKGMVMLANDNSNMYETGKFWCLEKGELAQVDYYKCRIPKDRKKKEGV